METERSIYVLENYMSVAYRSGFKLMLKLNQLKLNLPTGTDFGNRLKPIGCFNFGTS